MISKSGRYGLGIARKKRPAKPGKAKKREYNKTTKSPLRSDDRTIVAKNRKLILDSYDGTKKEKEESFMQDIDVLRKSHHSKYGPPTPYQAMKIHLNGGIGPIFYKDRTEHLNKLGLKKYDAKKIDSWTEKQFVEADELYQHIVARDGAKLYEEIKGDRTSKPKPTAKRK